MLRCPKCSRIYQTGTQRFCTHDGGRLMSVEPNKNYQNDLAGINFEESGTETQASWQPRRQTGRLVLPPQIEVLQNGFASPVVEKTNGKETKSENLREASVTVAEPEIAKDFNPLKKAAPVIERRPTGRLVLPSEIPASYAPTGDRSIRPTGRLPITAQNASVLVGQNVKGRYTVDKILKQDRNSVVYLAHDRLGEYRQVTIKIWLADFPPDSEEAQRLYDERRALSHLNHPNIARILDTGELTEGKPFVISEYPEGLTLREALQISGNLSAARTSRIVRQIAQALTEAHNNRLIHRNLNPDNIISNTIEGIEQAKVINFGILGDEAQEKPETLPYVAPERLIGQLSHAEGDIFSLGVIAYEMLTGQKPFEGNSADDLLNAEELGLVVKASNLRNDLSKSVDAVFERALAYNRAERFHHAREFGEALFVALIEKGPFSAPLNPAIVEKAQATVVEAESKRDEEVLDLQPAEIITDNPTTAVETDLSSEIEQPSQSESVVVSPDVRVYKQNTQSQRGNWLPYLLVFLGLILLASAFILGRNIFFRNQEKPAPYQPQPVTESVEPQKAPEQNAVPVPNFERPKNELLTNTNSAPPNYVQFTNSKENLDGKLAENFVPFSIFYPQDWKSNPNAGKPGAANFLDVSKRDPNELPLEELLASWYQSNGTFAADRETFPKLVKKLTGTYAKEIPAFREVSEGVIKFKDRDAYEVKFSGKTAVNGKSIEIWGRTIFLPVENDKAKSGLTLTMLATSLAPTLESLNDVGEKGDLSRILNTFEFKSETSTKRF